MSVTPVIERVHCNDCGHQTRHALVAERIQRGSDIIDGEFEISWRTRYTLLECQGCESVCLRKSFWFSEGDYEEDVTFYPPPIARQSPAWIEQVPAEIQGLLKEVYAALQAGSRQLAIMGARTVVDMVLNRKVGDIGGFEQKIDALDKSGYLGRRDRDVLVAALNAGHAVSHRGHIVTNDEAGHVMDIVENLLHADVLSESAGKLAASIPGRRPKPPESDPDTPA